MGETYTQARPEDEYPSRDPREGAGRRRGPLAREGTEHIAWCEAGAEAATAPAPGTQQVLSKNSATARSPSFFPHCHPSPVTVLRAAGWNPHCASHQTRKLPPYQSTGLPTPLATGPWPSRLAAAQAQPLALSGCPLPHPQEPVSRAPPCDREQAAARDSQA